MHQHQHAMRSASVYAYTALCETASTTSAYCMLCLRILAIPTCCLPGMFTWVHVSVTRGSAVTQAVGAPSVPLGTRSGGCCLAAGGCCVVARLGKHKWPARAADQSFAAEPVVPPWSPDPGGCLLPDVAGSPNPASLEAPPGLRPDSSRLSLGQAACRASACHSDIGRHNAAQAEEQHAGSAHSRARNHLEMHQAAAMPDVGGTLQARTAARHTRTGMH
ncbi:hypothetical protein COO60DRAFT_1539248 [Scenedesmus sp. NREL 46B-D3]|nr:hypothetical protein COO60DRAFT_1539248 [Scenedesmus sp. NREL 46B-D3]